MNKLLAFLTMMLLILYVWYGKAQHMHNEHQGSKLPSKAMGTEVLKTQKYGLSIEVYLNDIKSAMQHAMKESGAKFDVASLNPDITHHISVFVHGKDENNITGVTIEIKHKNVSKKYTLMNMKNHYGSDVSLKQKGKYEAIVTLTTENKRKLQFNFAFEI